MTKQYWCTHWDPYHKCPTEISATSDNFKLFSGCFWNSSTPEHRTEFDILHLLPIWVPVFQFNSWRLVASAKPVLQCLAKHNHTEAKNVKSDDADRQKKFYLLKGQRLCLLTIYRLQRVGQWISVYCEKRSDLMKVSIIASSCGICGYSGPKTPAWEGISPSWVPIVPAVAR